MVWSMNGSFIVSKPRLLMFTFLVHSTLTIVWVYVVEHTKRASWWYHMFACLLRFFSLINSPFYPEVPVPVSGWVWPFCAVEDWLSIQTTSHVMGSSVVWISSSQWNSSRWNGGIISTHNEVSRKHRKSLGQGRLKLTALKWLSNFHQLKIF